jgi:aldose 1-epimerase
MANPLLFRKMFLRKHLQTGGELEDPRLSRMYLALMLQSLGRMRRRLWHAAVMRSGLLTVLVLAVVLLGLAFGWREHRLGHFGQLKRQLNPKSVTQDTPVLRPGGQDIVQLQRSVAGRKRA